ncbi:MAG: hypothetical protein WBA10_17340 [Elainellaceae cyanobacterium]
MFDWIPFRISVDSTTIAGAALWALALYLGLSPVADWVTLQLNRWFNFAEQFLYTSPEALERARKGWESQNEFLASLLSILPFLVAGALCTELVEISLGRSWAISTGILATMACGIYELGRRTSPSSK